MRYFVCHVPTPQTTIRHPGQLLASRVRQQHRWKHLSKNPAKRTKRTPPQNSPFHGRQAKTVAGQRPHHEQADSYSKRPFPREIAKGNSHLQTTAPQHPARRGPGNRRRPHTVAIIPPATVPISKGIVSTHSFPDKWTCSPQGHKCRNSQTPKRRKQSVRIPEELPPTLSTPATDNPQSTRSQ